VIKGGLSMKYKRVLIILIGVTCLLAITSFAYIQASSKSTLKLAVSFPKERYKLGEPISPIFELINEGDKTITLWDKFGVETGFLHVSATKANNTNPIGFGNSRWGIGDSFFKTYLSPNQKIQSTAGILWSNGKNMKHEFRLTEASDYYFKIVYSAHLEEGKQATTKLESEPFKITIEEPKGEDLVVWNKIKDNGNFAYFIQEGNIPESIYKPEERAKFQAEVEQILTDYPNSFYAASLSQSLAKFKVSEAKRCELMEKMKAKP
jgi:hypothetical protein